MIILSYSRGPDYFFNENKPVGRYHRCHTLGFKNGLRVQKTPSQAIGGTKTIQDLLIAQPAQGEDTPFHGSLGYVDTCTVGKIYTPIFLFFRKRVFNIMTCLK